MNVNVNVNFVFACRELLLDARRIRLGAAPIRLGASPLHAPITRPAPKTRISSGLLLADDGK